MTAREPCGVAAGSSPSTAAPPPVPPRHSSSPAPPRSPGATFPAVTGDLQAQLLAELAAGPAVIGKLRIEGDSLLYPVGGRVLGDDGATIGYVVERRRISNPSQTIQTIALLSGLIGNEASIVAGNTDGSAWTDLTKLVSGVPITGSDQLWDYQRTGMPRTFACGRA